MAEISVIVPVYKVEEYLSKCVDSILCQSFQEFNLILVDDGSPDGCPAICDNYAKQDKRITVIHKQNGGLSDARNAGIDWAMEYSCSTWLAFVDSDDYLHVDYLKTLYDAAVTESADLAICDFCRVNDEENIIDENSGFFNLSTSDKDVLFSCLDKNWRIVPAWNKLYAKSLFEHFRFAFKKIHEDEFAIYLVLWNCKKAVLLNRQLYYYRCRQNSIMAKESPSSRMDGLEAALNQYEFCLDHNLPPRHSVVGVDFLNSVMELRHDLTKQELERYRDLKRRYAKLYFGVKRNHTLKRFLQYYCSCFCRLAAAQYHKKKNEDT